MASVYKKKGVLYISWWDPELKKTKNRSLKMKATSVNRITAKTIAKNLQKKLDNVKEELDQQTLTGSTINEAFQHFKANNNSKNVKTIKDYERFYSKFTETFNPYSSCRTITKLSAETWINSVKELPLSQNSIHGYFKQFNHFLNFLFEYNYTPMFRINRDVKTRPEVKAKVTFRDEDISRIFNNLTEKNDNFKIAVYLLFYTGLRSSDILQIKKEDVNLEECTLKYYSPKRKKYREIGFHQDLLEVLRSAVENQGTGKLLKYSSVENLGKAVNRFFVDLKIDGRNYSARTFRKTFITLCRTRYDMDASIVRELVGHEHGNTTDKYYNEITPERMKRELRKFRRPVVE